MSDQQRLWGGRFSGTSDEAFDRLNASFAVDSRMWAQDIEGSRAHVRMLAAVGVLSNEDAEAIAGGLDQVYAEFANGSFVVQPSDEDIHTAVERRLTELVGDPGRRVHTGRSRNDQVATDVLLYLRDAVDHHTRGRGTLREHDGQRAGAAGAAAGAIAGHAQRQRRVAEGERMYNSLKLSSFL